MTGQPQPVHSDLCEAARPAGRLARFQTALTIQVFLLRNSQGTGAAPPEVRSREQPTPLRVASEKSPASLSVAACDEVTECSLGL